MLRYARLEDFGHLLDHLDDGGGLVGGEDGGEEGAVVLVISVLRLLLQSEMSIVTRSPPIREEYRDHVTLSPPIPAHLVQVQRGHVQVERLVRAAVVGEQPARNQSLAIVCGHCDLQTQMW